MRGFVIDNDTQFIASIGIVQGGRNESVVGFVWIPVLRVGCDWRSGAVVADDAVFTVSFILFCQGIAAVSRLV